jgi:hypothetical protein
MVGELKTMINDHPDLDGRYMQWCEHLNVCEIIQIGSGSVLFICEDCGDTHPIETAEQWLPRLTGTRIEIGEQSE